MKFSSRAFGVVAFALLTLPTASAFQAVVPQSRKHSLRSSVGSLHASTQSAAYETVLQFNAQFKEGLLYALEPQSTASTHPSLDAIAMDVHNALRAAQEISSYGSNTLLAGSSDRRLDGSLEQKIQDYWSSQTMPGDGASGNTPLLDYVASTLSDNDGAKQSLFNFELPSDYDKVKFGFEVKTSLLDTLSDSRETSVAVLKGTRTISENVASYIIDQTKVSIETSAPLREDIANALVSNAERMGDAATKFAPYVMEQTRQSVVNSAPARDQLKTILVSNGEKVQGVSAQVGSFVSERIQQSIDTTVAQTAPVRDQVKRTVLDNSQRVQDATGQLGNALRQQTEQSYSNSASQIKAALLANTERLQGTGTAVSNNAEQLKAALAVSGERWQETNAQAVERMNANSAALGQLLGDTRNQIGEFHFPEVSVSPALSSWQDLASSTPGWTLAEVVDALKLKELGGWYAGALVGFLLLAAASNENQAEGPMTTLPSTKQSSPNSPKATPVTVAADSLDEKRRLEGMVVELTQAVAILTNELKTLKTERTQTSNALASLQTDVNNVKDEVGKNNSAATPAVAISEQHLRAKLTESDEHIETLQAQLEALGSEVLSVVTETPTIVAKDPRPPAVPPPAAVANVATTTMDESAFFATVVDKKGPIMVNGGTAEMPEPINGATGSANEWTMDRNPVSEFVAYWTSKRPRVPVEEGQQR